MRNSPAAPGVVQKMILVTGATGNVGRAVMTQLNPGEARALLRSTGADLARPETLTTALDGVDTVFLVWPFLTPDGAGETLDVINRHARRVIYLSSSAVRFGRDTDPITRLHADLEAPSRRPVSSGRSCGPTRSRRTHSAGPRNSILVASSAARTAPRPR